MKRIRPAPMGRAFRVVKRTAHLTVHVAERPLEISAVGTPEPEAEAPKRAARAQAKARPAAKATKAAKPAARKKAPAKKSAAPKKK